MMERRKIWLLLAAVLSFSCYSGLAEIHRAKSLNAKPRPHHRIEYQYPVWCSNNGRLLTVPGCLWENQNQTITWMNDVIWGHETQTWVFSIAASCLVGLSGIFPLLVIPIEAGKALRSGVACDRLKLLLSFAVGGLLGDVFLHLLPEAWAHLQKLGGDRRGHMQIGLWLLAGLLSFFMIQKIFPESSEDEGQEDAEDKSTDETRTRKKMPMDVEEMKQNNFLGSGGDSRTADKDETHKNGITVKKIDKNKTMMNGFNKNGKNGVNGWNKSSEVKNEIKLREGKSHNSKLCSEDEEFCWMTSVKNWVLGHKDSDDHGNEETANIHIKTSGWLNLVANMIDNFTHGLAVAGSYSISTKTGVLTTIAIMLHEIPHEIGDFAILLKAGFDRWKAAKAQLLTASGGIFGALVALAAKSTKEAGDTTAWILPFTAGGFIYIALVTVVPDLMKEVNPWNSLKQLICLCSGILIMATVTLLVD